MIRTCHGLFREEVILHDLKLRLLRPRLLDDLAQILHDEASLDLWVRLHGFLRHLTDTAANIDHDHLIFLGGLGVLEQGFWDWAG